MSKITSVLIKNKREWVNLNHENTITLHTLMANTEVALVTLTNSTGVKKQYDLLKIKSFVNANPTMTLVDYIEIDDFLLRCNGAEVQPIKTINDIKCTSFGDIWDYKLKVDRALYSPNALSVNDVYTPDLSIILTDGDTRSIDAIYKNYLFFVNGKVFFSDKVDNTLWLKKAVAHLDMGKHHQLSVLDFTALGGYETLKISSEMITVNLQTDNRCVATLTLPVDIGDKSILMVLNGRLHILDGTYRCDSNTTIVIDLNLNQVITEHYEYKADDLKWIAPLSLGGDGYDLTTFDVVKYLNVNSAVLMLPVKDLCIRETVLHKTCIPGKYTCANSPIGIMLFQDGSIGSYKVTEIASYGVSINSTTQQVVNKLSDSTNQAIGSNANLHFKSDYTSAKILDLYTL